MTFPKPVSESRTTQHEQPPAPPVFVNGLENFNLGFVPASVTPPSTWRKAAWFAALSSGGVVVALMVAGSVLVDQPEQPQSLDGWPDRNDETPLLPGEGYGDAKEPMGDPASSTSSETDVASSGEHTESNQTAGVRTTASQPPTSTTGADTSQQPSGSSSSPEASSSEPQKPEITPASTSQVVGLFALSASHDAETLAEHSQDYFNTVTEDSEAALDMTNGELAAEGTEGLRDKYGGIAYFEVQHVVIDDSEGVTISTVEATHPDGSKTEQTRTLVFNQDGEIVEDTADEEEPVDESSTSESPSNESPSNESSTSESPSNESSDEDSDEQDE